MGVFLAKIKIGSFVISRRVKLSNAAVTIHFDDQSLSSHVDLKSKNKIVS